MSAPLIVGAILVLLAIVIIARTVNIVQQGYVGMVKRVGEFHSVRQPGLTFLVPLVDSMVLVDIRETPRTGDKQDVITRDNVTVSVNATIFSQVVDPKLALFSVKSEGQQQSQINIADGQKQAQIKTAEGDKQSAILRAEGLRQATILEAEGRAQAVETVYKAIKDAAPDPILVSILQLDTLSKFANSENAKLVVPVETAGLLGAAQALRSVLDGVPTAAKP